MQSFISLSFLILMTLGNLKVNPAGFSLFIISAHFTSKIKLFYKSFT